MRRILCILLVALLLLSACVQAGTTYVDGYGYVPAEPSARHTPEGVASPIPPAPVLTPLQVAENGAASMEATKSPAARPTPAPVTPVPETSVPETSVPMTPVPETPMPRSSSTPQVSPTPEATPPLPEETPKEAKELLGRDVSKWPEESQLLYLDEQPGFYKGGAFVVSGGVFTKEDLNLLEKLINLKQWSSLSSLFGLFGIQSKLDVRLIDFAPEGIFEADLGDGGANLLFSEKGDYAAIHMASDDMRNDAADYVFVFMKEGENYTMGGAFRVPLYGMRYEGTEWGIEEYGGHPFFVHMATEYYPEETIRRERWYSLTYCEQKLNFVYKCERETDIAIEIYSTYLDLESTVETEYGFAMKAVAEVAHQVSDIPGSPSSFTLSTGDELILYYDGQYGRFATTQDRQGFFSDTGKIERGQYKYVFGEQLQQLAKAGRHANEVKWAQSMLDEQDWDAKMPEIGERTHRGFNGPGQEDDIVANFVMNTGRNTAQRLFTERTIGMLAEDIRGMRHESLKQLLGSYGFDKEWNYYSDLPEEVKAFDVVWEDVRHLTCTVDFHTARERLVSMHLRYQEHGRQKGVLVLFTLVGDAWQLAALYGYTQRGEGETYFSYKNGLLGFTYPKDMLNKAPVYETLRFQQGGACVLRYVSRYTGKDGVQYEIEENLFPYGSLGHTLRLYATLPGADGALLLYSIPMVEADERSFLEFPSECEPLLDGRVETHAGYQAALESALLLQKGIEWEEGEQPPQKEESASEEKEEGETAKEE